MQVKQLEAKLNIEILDLSKEANIGPKDVETLTIKLVECEHFKNLKPKTLLSSRTISCSQCRMTDKYKDKSNININFNDCTIKCLDCNEIYHREAYCLTKDINKFNCYCKLKRFGEQSFYKSWKFANEAYDEQLMLYRSYGKYNTGRNHSSDFYVLHNGKTFIIHLNDKSHCNEINRGRDKFKLGLTSKDRHIYNIYVCEKYYDENPIETIQSVRKCILDVGADDIWYKAQNVCFIDDRDHFHEYLREYILECKPELINYDYYGNIIKTDDVLESDQDSMKSDENELKDDKIVE